MSDISESLLYRLLRQPVDFDRYIIVGGYLYEQLEEAVHAYFPDMEDKILLVENKKYAQYGSGYSLYMGLKAVMEMDFDEVVFVEGDLAFDTESFQSICASRHDVITCSRDAILADRDVAFYLDEKERVRYVYDTGHHALMVPEPFLGIYSSGQVWKFAQPERLKAVCASMEEKDWRGTNLAFVERYFCKLLKSEYEIIYFKNWINCNTVEDFNRISW